MSHKSTANMLLILLKIISTTIFSVQHHAATAKEYGVSMRFMHIFP